MRGYARLRKRHIGSNLCLFLDQLVHKLMMRSAVVRCCVLQSLTNKPQAGLAPPLADRANSCNSSNLPAAVAAAGGALAGAPAGVFAGRGVSPGASAAAAAAAAQDKQQQPPWSRVDAPRSGDRRLSGVCVWLVPYCSVQVDAAAKALPAQDRLDAQLSCTWVQCCT